MKRYGFSVGVNVYARNLKEAEELAEEYLTRLRNDNGEERESEASVDSAELVGSVEELE